MPMCEAALSVALVFVPVNGPLHPDKAAACFADFGRCAIASGVANDALMIEARATGYGPHIIARCDFLKDRAPR